MRSNRLGPMHNPPFDWPGLIRLGMGRLGLPPDTFWAMTPWELRLVLEGAGLIQPLRGGGRMDRGTLQALMTRHPDAPKQET